MMEIYRCLTLAYLGINLPDAENDTSINKFESLCKSTETSNSHFNRRRCLQYLLAMHFFYSAEVFFCVVAIIFICLFALRICDLCGEVSSLQQGQPVLSVGTDEFQLRHLYTAGEFSHARSIPAGLFTNSTNVLWVMCL